MMILMAMRLGMMTFDMMTGHLEGMMIECLGHLFGYMENVTVVLLRNMIVEFLDAGLHVVQLLVCGQMWILLKGEKKLMVIRKYTEYDISLLTKYLDLLYYLSY